MTKRRETLAKAFLVLCFCFFAASSPAAASVLDPIPIFKTVHESPHEEALFSKKSEPFFCPLSKNFYNRNDEIAVQTIILEALGEGYQGMVAVGEVIRNRAGLFLKDYDTVCLMPKQFSCWNDGGRAENFLEKYHEYYFIAALAWHESKKGVLTRGATDYHTDEIHPYWADAYRVAAQIGKHIFYVRK